VIQWRAVARQSSAGNSASATSGRGLVALARGARSRAAGRLGGDSRDVSRRIWTKWSDMMLRTTALALAVIVVMDSASSANPELIDEKIFGDWKTYKYRDYGGFGSWSEVDMRQIPFKLKSAMSTSALNAREAQLKIDCRRYDVHYTLEAGDVDPFFSAYDVPEGGSAVDQFVYIKTNKDNQFRKTLSFRAEDGE
jgi:hypothetical protein